MKRKERWRTRKRMRRHLSNIGYWHHDTRSHAAQNAQVHPDLWFLCDGCQQPIPGGKRRFAARYMDTKGRMAALLVGTRNSLVAAKGLIPTLTGSNWHKDCKVCENFTCKPQRLWETAVLKSDRQPVQVCICRLCTKCFRIRRHPHAFVRKRVPDSCMPPEDCPNS